MLFRLAVCELRGQGCDCGDPSGCGFLKGFLLKGSIGICGFLKGFLLKGSIGITIRVAIRVANVGALIVRIGPKKYR